MDMLPLDALMRYPHADLSKVEELYQESLKKLDRKIVVLDDDPTGVQTVHDIFVYTSWDEETLTQGFHDPQRIFYVLTNSRGFTSDYTKKVHGEIGESLVKISEMLGKEYILISRSDSTMRGHYPLETQTLKEKIEGISSLRFDGEILAPFFMEGGRYTLDNVHYVEEGETLVPAGETEFARDKTFGYHSSNIGEYIKEKTKGQYKAENTTFITLEELRALDLSSITHKLMTVKDFGKVVINAVSYADIKVFYSAFVEASLQGKNFLFRSAAAIPKILGGITDIPLLAKEQLILEKEEMGGIILIGSHVSKTTQQLEALQDTQALVEFIEFNQHRVLEDYGLEEEVERVISQAEKIITSGKNVLVYTRRERFDLDSSDKDKQLEISVKISDAVTSIIGKLTVKPRFIIAKGGITSSDVGTKALRVKKALVMGQIKPGIPVWMTGKDSKFPDMPYIIFPGNVGEKGTLKEIVELLSSGI